MAVSTEQIEFSVIICTYNRCHLLAPAMESVLTQDFPPEDFELMLVDNNSTDDTRKKFDVVIERYPNHNVRYLMEKQQGLSFARNAAAHAARGKVLAYIDDDCEVLPDWLTELSRSYKAHPDVVCMGGRIVADWVDGKPDWFEGTVKHTRELNLGDEDREIVPPSCPVGANLSILRKTLIETGGFSSNLGRKKKTLLSNEENELFLRLHKANLKAYYSAKAIVRHKTFRSEVTRMFMLKRFYWQGISDVVLENNIDKSSSGKMLKKGLNSIRTGLAPALGRLVRELVRARHISFDAMVLFAYQVGKAKQQIFSGLAFRPAQKENDCSLSG